MKVNFGKFVKDLGRAFLKAPISIIVLVLFIIYLVYYPDDFYGVLRGADFMSNFLATLIGVGVGFELSGLSREIRENREARERKVKILSALREELEITMKDLSEYKVHLETDKDKTIDLRLVRAETWNAFKQGGELEWIKDPFLLNQLAETYHLINKVNFVSEKFFEIVGEGRRLLVADLQLTRLIEGIGKALDKIESVLKLI